jgi:hypothetical protein
LNELLNWQSLCQAMLPPETDEFTTAAPCLLRQKGRLYPQHTTHSEQQSTAYRRAGSVRAGNSVRGTMQRLQYQPLLATTIS